MDQRIPSIRLDRTKLIRVCTSIPNAIQKIVIAVEISSVVLQLVVRPMRHGGEVDRNLSDFDRAATIVENGQVSECSPLVLRRESIRSGSSDVEEHCFVAACVGGGIAVPVCYPETRFGECDA